MKETLKVFLAIILNWRIDLITVAYAFALLNAMADCSNFLVVLATKIIAVALAYITTKLYQKWDKEGYLKELEVFNDNEDNDDND